MIHPNDRITTPQAAVIIANSLLAAGIVTLPRVLAEKMNTPDGWIAVIAGSVISLVLGLIIVNLSQRFPGKTFFEYSQSIVGKWLGRSINLALIVYCVLLAGFELRSMAEIVNYLLLERTPKEVIIIVFIFVGVYLTVGGLNPIARLVELVLPITVILLITNLLLSLKIFDIDNLRPVLGMGIMPVLKGIPVTWLSYAGLETMLFVTAFMDRPEKAGKALLVGILIPAFFYLFTVITVIGSLSVEQVATLTWPTISAVRSYEYTGILLERYESLLIVVWLIQIFTTYAIYHYFVALGLSHTFKKSYQKYIYAVLPIFYLIAMYPKNINQLYALGDFIGRIFMGIAGLLAPILLVISWLRERAHEQK